jgi:hypothetical protein
MRCLVPRIDAPDPSYGTAAPAYALTPALPSLGSEYLLLGLGAGMLGAFSLATGQLVAELFPGIPHRAWGDLEVFASGVVAAAREDGAGRPADAGAGTVALPGFALGHYASLALARFGSAVAACGDSGRTLLVAAPAGGKGVYVFELDMAAARMAAEEAAAAARRGAAAAAVQQAAEVRQRAPEVADGDPPAAAAVARAAAAAAATAAAAEVQGL